MFDVSSAIAQLISLMDSRVPPVPSGGIEYMADSQFRPLFDQMTASPVGVRGSAEWKASNRARWQAGRELNRQFGSDWLDDRTDPHSQMFVGATLADRVRGADGLSNLQRSWAPPNLAGNGVLERLRVKPLLY